MDINKEYTGLLEAFNSVYETKETVEVLEEGKIATGTGKKVMPSAKERSELAKKARAGKDIGKPGKGFEKVAAKAAKQYGSIEAGERVAAAAMFKAQAHKEEVETDNWDLVLEYLVAEGHAETNKEALAIMANMTPEDIKGIVEATYGGEKPTDTPADTRKVVTNADKAGNTRAYQELMKKNPNYVAAPHLKGV